MNPAQANEILRQAFGPKNVFGGGIRRLHGFKNCCFLRILIAPAGSSPDAVSSAKAAITEKLTDLGFTSSDYVEPPEVVLGHPEEKKSELYLTCKFHNDKVDKRITHTLALRQPA